MYYVTYKNVLKTGKQEKDFLEFLKRFWPVQQGWGATHFDLWDTRDGGRCVLYCRFTVPNIDRWNRCALGPEGDRMNRALGRIADMDLMSLKITAVRKKAKWGSRRE